MIKRRSYEMVTRVWLRDPALDYSDPEAFERALREYLKDGDVRHLPVKDGQRPTEFDLQPLTDEDWVHARQALGAIGDYGEGKRTELSKLLLADVWRELVARSLKAVRYLDGFSLKMSGNRVAPESLKEIYIPSLIEDLARHVIRASDPDPLFGLD